jgi:hypothetical protein
MLYDITSHHMPVRGNELLYSNYSTYSSTVQHNGSVRRRRTSHGVIKKKKKKILPPPPPRFERSEVVKAVALMFQVNVDINQDGLQHKLHTRNFNLSTLTW